MLSNLLLKVAGMELAREELPYRMRPSLAGPDRCIRQLVFHALDTPQDRRRGDRLAMTMDDSSWHEELTKDWLRKSAYTIHSDQMEVQTPCGPGHIDGILTDLLEVDRLFEHKALNHFSFNRLWAGTWPLDYFTQCALYIVGLQRINPDISEATLLIKNKNTAQYLDYRLQYLAATDTLIVIEVERSGEGVKSGEGGEPLHSVAGIVGAAARKFAEVEAHRVAGTLPDRPFPIGTDFPCGYCSWETTCWAGYEAEFKELSEDAELSGDWASKLGYYRELVMTEGGAKKEKDVLALELKKALHEMHVRKGRAGNLIALLQLQKRSILNPDRLTPEERERATETRLIEILRVSEPKQPKEKSNVEL